MGRVRSSRRLYARDDNAQIHARPFIVSASRTPLTPCIDSIPTKVGSDRPIGLQARWVVCMLPAGTQQQCGNDVRSKARRVVILAGGSRAVSARKILASGRGHP